MFASPAPFPAQYFFGLAFVFVLCQACVRESGKSGESSSPRPGPSTTHGLCLVGLGLCLLGDSVFFPFFASTTKLYTYIIYAIIDFICGFDRVGSRARDSALWESTNAAD